MNLKKKIFNMTYRKLTPAFTMIELMLVIIILGIVSSIGAEVISKVYQGYIMQRAQHRASIKTELAALQIANRMAAVIPSTIKRIKNDNSYESIESGFAGDGSDYKGFKWVGSDMDSFATATPPGWSGFCDLYAASTATPTIAIPGSDIQLTADVVTNLGADFDNFTPSLFFPNDPNPYIIGAYSAAPQTLTLVSVGGHPLPTEIHEHYKLAWTSYALVVENNAEGGKDLNLYYNFRPTPDEPYGNAPHSLLLHNISTFRFKGAGRTLRFKICKQERITEDLNVTSCKEKAVF